MNKRLIFALILTLTGMVALFQLWKGNLISALILGLISFIGGKWNDYKNPLEKGENNE